MKKYLLIVVAGLSISAAHSQEISTVDAIRYSQQDFSGTSRFRAMGGAFGALGGDLSAISVNPAGSAVFVNNQFGATIGVYNTKTDSDYFGTSTSENDSSFDFGQAGAVFVFDTDADNTGWRKVTLAVTYENQLLDNTLFSAGTNPTNSVANYFLNFANMDGGVPLNQLENSFYEDFGFGGQQAYLGYQGYVINPTTGAPENTSYFSNIPTGGNYFHENIVESSGYNGKVTFNAATQYGDKFYFGLNLNSHFTDYRQVSSIFESNTNDPDAGLQRVRFTNELYTYGSGFSFGLGTIAKVTPEIRLGLSYESPTWFRLYDELSQSIRSVITDGTNEQDVVVNPGIINVYDGYRLQTPGKFTGSFAYVFGTKGLISVDYALKDYSNTKFGPNSDYRSLNNEMSNTLATTSEIRVGAEYRIKEFSLRGGYRYSQSPYENTRVMGDLNGISAGIGYNFGGTKLDLAYSYSQRDYQQAFLTSGLTDSANFSAVNNNVSLTLLFDL